MAMLGAVTVLISMLGGAKAEPGTLDVIGRWYTPEEATIIEVYDCGDGSPCGRVAWIADVEDNMFYDHNNPEPDKRGQPLLGMTLLHGFESGGYGWQGGSIYNPKDGREYRAKMRRLDEETVELKGCVGPICRGQIWTSVNAGVLPLGE